MAALSATPLIRRKRISPRASHSNRAKRALVIGAGNVLLSDDGAGVKALELLERSYVMPDGVECVDGGTAGVNLLDSIRAFDHIIIIDTVKAKRPAGSVIRIAGGRVPGNPTTRASAHALGINDLIELARFEGLDAGIVVIGIVPDRIKEGLKLTPAVEKGLLKAVRMVRKELEASGFRLTARGRDA